MKTAEQIIEIATARGPSDFDAEPPRIAMVQFKRVELQRALSPRKDVSKRAAELLVGVTAVQPGKNVVVVREHLLVALGAMEEEGDDPSHPGIEGDV